MVRLFWRDARRARSPFRSGAHREAARHRGRATHLSRRRAGRVAHRQAHLSNAWHPRRAPPPVEGRDHDRPHAPAPLARLPHRAADLRMAPRRGRQGAAVRGARAGPPHVPVPAVRAVREAADPAPLWAALRARTFAVQVARGWYGRRGSRPRRALAQILDPGRRRHGRRNPHRTDPGRPGHPPGNRSLERGDVRRQSFLTRRVGWIQEGR